MKNPESAEKQAQELFRKMIKKRVPDQKDEKNTKNPANAAKKQQKSAKKQVFEDFFSVARQNVRSIPMKMLGKHSKKT